MSDKSTQTGTKNARSYADRMKNGGGDPTHAPEATSELVPIDAAAQERALAAAGAIAAAGMAGTMSAELAAELANGEAFEVAPQIIKLEPGMYVKGTLVGEGLIESTDMQTGEVKPLRTWVLEDDHGHRAAIISTYQLERDLQNHEKVTEIVAGEDGKPVLDSRGRPVERTHTRSTPRIGEWVMICRQNDERSRTNKVVAKYLIAFKRRQGDQAGVGKAGQ